MSDAQVPPPVRLLEMLTGKWVSQAISVAAKLNLADHLAQSPRSAEELAPLVGAHAGALHRLLRALACVGVFVEEAPGRFANSALSETLRSDVPGSMRAMSIFFGDHPTWAPWGKLLHSVQTGRSAFQHVHGLLPFAYYAQHPEDARTFDQAMTAFSLQEAEALLRACDFGRTGVIADIAGGQGALLMRVLQANPEQQGILFDLPPVVEAARARVEASDVAARCRLMSGSFFEEVPRADAYILKHILHDWSDEDAVRILRTLQRVATAGARLYVIDAVIAPGNRYEFAKLMDLEMLVLYDGGRERTAAELGDLLDAAGFEVLRVLPTGSPASVIEAIRR